MKVLFISSGNSANGISSIITNQGKSIIKQGVELDYFIIKGKGVFGYLKAIPQIKEHLKKNKYDIIHAHYSFSAFAASLAGVKPLVVSLMGSDVRMNDFYRYLIKYFNQFFWSAVIVKSEDMKKTLSIDQSIVIPNGVDFKKYTPMEKLDALKITKWDKTKTNVLFTANPDRYVKNFKLAEEAFNLLINTDIELHVLNEVPNEQMPFYFYAADVILLTSLWEGSPNVIKEAMACNRPIVSTNVGDVRWLFGDLPGHFLTSYDPADIADKVEQAIIFSQAHKHTNGSHRIIELGLVSDNISKRLVSVYNDILCCS